MTVMLILIILFLPSKTQSYTSLLSLYQQKTTEDYQNFKGFERSVFWNENKTKSENKNTTNEYRYFLESNFVGVNKLYVLVYSNANDNAKRY